jgi:hypothetical protein
MLLIPPPDSEGSQNGKNYFLIKTSILPVVARSSFSSPSGI